MPRHTKRQAKGPVSNAKKPPTNGTSMWSSKPGSNLSLLLSKVRAAQVRRLHFR